MWPDSHETRELLDQAAAGSPEAVNRLLDRHRDALRRMVQIRLDQALAQRIDASDIVQEVLLEASRRLSGYLENPQLPFHLWLRHLAKDQMIDAHRRHRVAQRRSTDRERPLQAGGEGRSSVDLAPQLKDDDLTPAAEALRREFETQLLAALERLEDDDREVILMRHFEQLSNSEVAAALGLSQPAAGMRHLRALRRLKEKLGDLASLTLLRR
jgi:RNA polymerase sigma-70 factor (ECF subfamily)